MATQFTASVKKGGSVGTDCDYTTLSAALTGLANDLTAATMKVFAVSAHIGTLAAGTAVTGGTSGATGVIVLVNYDFSQVWIKTIAVSTFQSGEHVYKTSDGAPGTNEVTLADAGDSVICGIRCRAGSADTTAVTITGFTTSATNYIRIYADEAAAMATMPYTSTGYRLEVSSGIAITWNEEFVRLEHISIKETQPAFANARYAINMSVTSATGDQRIIGCYILNVANASNTTVVYGVRTGNNEKLTIINTVFDGWSDVGNVGNTAVSRGSGTITCHNVTVVNSAVGFTSTTSITCKNCLYDGGTSGNQVGFGTMNAASDYNASNDATAPGAHSRVSQTFTFAGAGDYHLAAADGGARTFGTDLSGATIPFTDDFDSVARGATWDIGADQYVAAGAALPVFQNIQRQMRA